MATSAIQASLEEPLREMMAEARADDQFDRRGAARYPFFRQARLEDADSRPCDCVAFTRELSMVSLGLLHNISLAPGWVTVLIPRRQGGLLPLAPEIPWCRPCGEGWHLS